MLQPRLHPKPDKRRPEIGGLPHQNSSLTTVHQRLIDGLGRRGINPEKTESGESNSRVIASPHCGMAECEVFRIHLLATALNNKTMMAKDPGTQPMIDVGAATLAGVWALVVAVVSALTALMRF